MKQVFFVLFILVSVGCFAQQPIVKHVVTHNRTTVVCDPAKANKVYAAWGVFPSEKFPVRKMKMHVTLGSPDSILTAHWDYLDHITLRRKGGVKGKSLDYEIGRILTPYGSIYNKGWHWTWEVDVTDFAPLLRDSVEVEFNHSGYEATSVGWALTIDFEIVSGPQVVAPLGMKPLWNGNFPYGDPNNKIEDKLLPINYESPSNAAINRIRIQHTGHGMDKPKGCSEFCSRWRMLKVDDNVVDKRNMWKDCGANPLYPQGGTWVYDRAYWCPGDLQVPDVIDVMTNSGNHTVSMQMEPYTATENIQAIESVSSYLFYYSKPTAKVDVSIDKIMAPTDEQQYFRLNPASFNPRFVIRNLGSENLRSVMVTYGTVGFPANVYRWKGNLKFNETAEILIPGEINSKPGKNLFKVSLTKPNGGKDAWEGDNELTSTFEAPKVLPTNFILKFMTNNRPKDNHVYLVGGKSKIMFERTPQQLDSVTLYTDTIRLAEGKYDLCLTDSAGDGLEFWAEPQNGDGHLRLFDMSGNLIHAFESDCGNGEKLSFTASSGFVNDTTVAKYAFSLYPRLITTNTDLTVVSNRSSKMTVQITVNGIVHEKHDYIAVKGGKFSYYLGNLPQGRIVLEVFMDGVSKFKGRLNKK
jgi:hypothetical protein